MGLPLRDFVKPVITEIEMRSLRGKIVGIDAYNYLYSFLMAIRATGTVLEYKGKTTAQLNGFFYKTAEMLSLGIKPLFVVEGKKTGMKSATLEKRKEMREQAFKDADKALEEGNYEKYNKKIASTITVKDYMITDLEKLVTAFGLPFIKAAGEGEAQLSYMCRKGEIDIVATQDYDAFLFGAPTVGRNFLRGDTMKIQGRVIELKKEIISLEKFLDFHGITMDKLIDIAILSGTDFNKGIEKVGIKTAMKHIKKYDTIEELVNFNSTFAEKIDMQVVKQVREIFKNPDINPEYTIDFKDVNYKEVYRIMVKDFGFKDERVKKRLVELHGKRSSRIKTLM